jgi:hypothetical protein
VEQWSLSLDSWIVQDGNYPDFESGQHAEFAVEFDFPEPPELTDQLLRVPVWPTALRTRSPVE